MKTTMHETLTCGGVTVLECQPFFIRKASEPGMALSTGILFLLSLGASAIIPILRGVLKLQQT
jgi:hypothetical protein